MLESNTAVLKQARAALQHRAHLDIQHNTVQLDFDSGVLTLVGEVPNIECKKLASEAVGTVEGVREVIDQLRISPDERLGDGAIRDLVCEHLLQNVDFHNCDLNILNKGQIEVIQKAGEDSSGSIVIGVEDGVITLSGQVISLSHQRLAGVLAWWARGRRDVINLLKVVPAEEDNDDEVTDAIRLILETDPLIPADQIQIHSTNGVVLLEGLVRSEEEKRRSELNTWYVLGVKAVTNQIIVRS